MTTPIKTAPDHQPYMDAMTTPTPRTDAAIKFVREQFHNDDCPDDHAAYAVAYLGGELTKMERDLAAAQEARHEWETTAVFHQQACKEAQEARDQALAIARELARLATCMDALPRGSIGTQVALLEDLERRVGVRT